LQRGGVIVRVAAGRQIQVQRLHPVGAYARQQLVNQPHIGEAARALRGVRIIQNLMILGVRRVPTADRRIQAEFDSVRSMTNTNLEFEPANVEDRGRAAAKVDGGGTARRSIGLLVVDAQSGEKLEAQQPLLDGIQNFALDTGHDKKAFLAVSIFFGPRCLSNDAHLGRRRGGCQTHDKGSGAR
jgi:hypothetical protein